MVKSTMHMVLQIHPLVSMHVGMVDICCLDMKGWRMLVEAGYLYMFIYVITSQNRYETIFFFFADGDWLALFKNLWVLIFNEDSWCHIVLTVVVFWLLYCFLIWSTIYRYDLLHNAHLKLEGLDELFKVSQV